MQITVCHIKMLLPYWLLPMCTSVSTYHQAFYGKSVITVMMQMTKEINWCNIGEVYHHTHHGAY